MPKPFRVRRVLPPTQRSRFGKVGAFPLTIKPTRSEPFKDKILEPKNGVVVYRRGYRIGADKREELERRAVPIEQVFGSVHERIFYRELQKRRIHFDFQSSMQGGRMELGGISADFMLPGHGGRAGLVVEVQGTFWHKGMIPESEYKIRFEFLTLRGYDVLELWDYEIEDPIRLETWMKRYIDTTHHIRVASR